MLVRPADVYLLDEPLSHLDAKLRAAMRAELKQLGAMSNTTTIYVTHDYQEALALGDRIAVMREGTLVQIGTPDEIWRRPADTFVARSLGQPEINVLDGVVDDGRIRLTRRLAGCRDARRTLPSTGVTVCEWDCGPAISMSPAARARCAAQCCWPSGSGATSN